MSNRNTIQDELNELNSGLNSKSDSTPYSVPEGYFDGLAASVLAKVKSETPISASAEIAELSPLLAGISKKTPYSVPEDFFESNIEDIKAFTSESEESLVLSFIEKKMPYEVPTGYFAGISERVLQKVSNQGAKVVPLMRRKWIRMAVAAMATGVMAISGIIYFTNRGGNKADSNDAVLTAVKKASTEELNEFIKTTVVDITDDKVQVTAQNKTPKTEAKKLFADVSDKELDNFLDQMPADDEIDIN